MSEIKIDSCRSDGLWCPECSRVPTRRVKSICGCSVCIDVAANCAWNHTEKLLEEAIRQRDLQTDHLAETRVKHQQKRDSPHIMVHRQLWEQMKEERDAALRQVEEQRHPCPCGKDTASIKWARCYSCRQAEAEEMEALRGEHAATANLLARIHRDGGHHTDKVGFVQSCADAEERWMELMERAGK